MVAQESRKFSWGKVIDRFDLELDSGKTEIIKYHPWACKGTTILVGTVDTSEVEYHCEEVREGSKSLDYLILSIIAHKRLGPNQGDLVSGVFRALGGTNGEVEVR